MFQLVWMKNADMLGCRSSCNPFGYHKLWGNSYSNDCKFNKKPDKWCHESSGGWRIETALVHSIQPCDFGFRSGPRQSSEAFGSYLGENSNSAITISQFCSRGAPRNGQPPWVARFPIAWWTRHWLWPSAPEKTPWAKLRLAPTVPIDLGEEIPWHTMRYHEIPWHTMRLGAWISHPKMVAPLRCQALETIKLPSLNMWKPLNQHLRLKHGEHLLVLLWQDSYMLILVGTRNLRGQRTVPTTLQLPTPLSIYCLDSRNCTGNQPWSKDSQKKKSTFTTWKLPCFHPLALDPMFSKEEILRVKVSAPETLEAVSDLSCRSRSASEPILTWQNGHRWLMEKPVDCLILTYYNNRNIVLCKDQHN